MYKHPLTAIGALLVAYAIFTFLYYASGDATDRRVEYVGAYVSVFVGAFSILIGIIVQGFKRLERLIVYRDMGKVEADGMLGSIFDSRGMKETHLKGENKKQ